MALVVVVWLMGCAERRWVGVTGEPQPAAATCATAAERGVTIVTDHLGGWSVALPQGMTSTKISRDMSPGAAAMALDHRASGVAGFVVRRPQPGDDLIAEVDAVRAMLGSLGGTFSNAGVARATHGQRGILGLSGTIARASTDPGSLRQLLLNLLLADSSPLPEPEHSAVGPGSRFVLSVMLRDDGHVVVIGGLAPLEHFEHRDGLTRAIVEDLGNGTALAKAGAGTTAVCRVESLDVSPKIDMIWVVDESGSMQDNREAIAEGAAELFDAARAAGLDFRMGVAGMAGPLGKFCSRESADVDDDGGDDRFLGAGEAETFSACVRNPPGYNGGREYGLLNARAAVERHLPRGVGGDRIRPEAHLAVMIVTDEVPASLFADGILGYSDLDSCTLGPSTAPLAQALAPYERVFGGQDNPQSAARIHLIGGVCNNACKADVAHGYRELVSYTGGQIFDVCRPERLGAVLKQLLAGEGLELALTPRPISSTLAVFVDRKPVQRGEGFGYDHARNSITLGDLPLRIGAEIVVAYRAWQ